MSSKLYAGFSSTHFLTYAQLKARTGLSRRKIDALVEAKTFQKFVRPKSGQIVFCGVRVDDWIDAQIALELASVQRRASTHIVLKAIGEQNENTKFCAASLFLKRGILDSSGKLAVLSRGEVSDLVRPLFSVSDTLVSASADQGHASRPLCFPVLNELEGGEWRVDFVLEVLPFVEPRKFVGQLMTAWRQNRWSTDTWSVEVLEGREQVQAWFYGLDVAIDNSTVDHSKLYIPHDARYALSPPTVAYCE